MRSRTELFAALVAVVIALAGTPALADSCVDCHADLPDPLGPPVEGMKSDVHAKAGLSCADCHGGDPNDPNDSAMDKAKGYRGKPEPADIPAFCGRCHADGALMRRYNPSLPTDQLAQYRTSVHGQHLAAGDTRVATCVSCHGVHGIKPGSDVTSPVHKTNVATTCAGCHADATHMAGYGIPTDQLAKFQRSVHGRALLVERDLAAPTCNSCHGNHGAFPPGADSVAAVCGQCHVTQKDFFIAGPHRAAFGKQGLPECVVCHSNHDIAHPTDDFLGTASVAVCVTCHKPDDKGWAAAARMRNAVDQLRNEIDSADATLVRAATAGMEVSEPRFTLQAAREALVATRTQVHSADPAAVAKTAGGGLAIARAAEQAGTQALSDLDARRWAALIPLTAIALLAALLYMRIRS
jgi:cytochrome c3-like protein